MATEVIRYVNTAAHTSGDGTTNGTGNGGTNSFVSLSEAITGCLVADALAVNSPNLVTADVQLTIKCSGAADDTTAVTINGFTTDATRYILIEAYTGQEAQMPLDTNRYTLLVNGSAITISDPFVYLRRLQMGAYNHASAGSRKTIYYTGLPAGAQYVERCLIFGDFTSGMGQDSTGLALEDGDPTYYIINNFIVNFDQGTTATAVGSAGNAPCYLYGNTAVNCIRGYVSSGTGMHAKNNGYAKGATGTDGFNGTFNADATGNISDIADDTPATTAGPPSFVSSTNFHLVSGDAWVGQGADLRADAAYNVTVDFDGDTRAAAPCVGADEYIAAAAGIGRGRPFTIKS